MIRAGPGPTAVRKSLKEIVFLDPSIAAVVADPEENNLRSLRAFERAEFMVLNAVQLPGETCEGGLCACVAPIPGRDAPNRAAYFLSASVGSFADPPRSMRFPSGYVMFLPTARFPRSLD
jgi:hypothetical protein